MTPPLRQLQAVAISYAMIGALYLILAILIARFTWRAWTGPLASHEIASDAAKSIASFAAIAVGYAILAGLALRLLSLGIWWRTAIVAASLALALWSIGGAVRLTIQGVPEAMFTVSPAIMLGIKWGLALSYSICAYLLCQNARAPRQLRASRADVVE